MRYFFVSVPSYKQAFTAPKPTVSVSGLVIFYVKDSKSFFGIGTSTGKNLAPHWRRSVAAQGLLSRRLLTAINDNNFRQVRVSDFKRVFIALRNTQLVRKDWSRAWLGSEALDVVQFNTHEEARFSLAIPKLHKHLIGVWHGFEEQMILQNSNAVTDQAIHSLRTKLAFLPKDFAPELLYTSSFRTAAAFLLAVGWNHRSALVTGWPKNSISSFVPLHLRKILVITNLNGPELPALKQDVEFWTRGHPGFIWKHIYGKIGRQRLQQVLAGKHYDVIVYRGHASVQNGKLTAPEGLVLKELPCRLFIHFGCTDFTGFDDEADDNFKQSAPWCILPAFRLVDFNERDLFTRMIGQNNRLTPPDLMACLKGTNFVFTC